MEEKDLQRKIRWFFWKREHQIGILTCVTILALLIAFWNAAQTRQELEYSTREYCEEVTSQMRDAVNSGIDAKMIDLVNVADSVSQVFDGSDPAALDGFLARKAGILEFDALFLVNSEGDSIASTVEEAFELNKDTVKAQIDADPSFLEKVHVGFIEGQMLFYSAPVHLDQASSYVLIGIRGKEVMQRIITSSAFQGNTISCVIDNQGNVVLAPTDLKPFTDLESIFNSHSEGGTAQELTQEIRDDLAAGRSGSLRFTSVTGRKNLLTYNPLQNNQWFLLTIVPVNLMAGDVSAYFLRTMLVVLGLALVFLLFLMMIYRINSDSQKQLSRLAYEDDVTGGMNNTAFQQRYRQVLREQPSSRPAVVLLNVRRFKLINEKLGFGTGNQILRIISQEINKHLYKKQNEFSARSEMDNFFLCLNEKQPQQIWNRVQEMETAVNQRLNESYPGTQLTFTAGCYLVEDPATDIRIIQDRARTAARDEAVNVQEVCSFYSDGIAERIKREQELEAMFDTALANRSFQVYLQPKVNLKSGRLVGAEALVRWKHPTLGVISPADFIPLFERNGKICSLDFYVFEEVCRFYRQRTAEGKPWYPVSVNLSRYHFYENHFLDKFQAVRQEYGLPDGAIEFELTESMFFDQEHNERIKRGIEQMHRMGFRCSMDDFGSGYSSLGILKEFDVDTLKMDRSFFLDMESEKARDIIRSVVELAGKLKMETVAEGIEQTDQMEFLHSIRCDTVQGYFFSRPLPVDEFESWASQYETGNPA